MECANHDQILLRNFRRTEGDGGDPSDALISCGSPTGSMANPNGGSVGHGLECQGEWSGWAGYWIGLAPVTVVGLPENAKRPPLSSSTTD